MNFSFDLRPEQPRSEAENMGPAQKNLWAQKDLQNPDFNGKIKKTKNIWNQDEKHRYVKCLKQYRHIFAQFTDQKRKKAKCNLLLSQHVETRTHEQCRSHHQKELIKYGSVDAIIKGQVTGSHKKQKKLHACQPSRMVQDSQPKLLQIESEVLEQPLQSQAKSQAQAKSQGRSSDLSDENNYWDWEQFLSFRK